MCFASSATPPRTTPKRASRWSASAGSTPSTPRPRAWNTSWSCAATLEELRDWLLARRTLKTTGLGAPVNYTLKSSHHLQRFTTDARIWLDNNVTERSLRGPVVGRRNHFGSKSKAGTQVAAVFYTLMETAKVRGVDPAKYLREAVLAARAGRVLLPGEQSE